MQLGRVGNEERPDPCQKICHISSQMGFSGGVYCGQTRYLFLRFTVIVRTVAAMAVVIRIPDRKVGLIATTQVMSVRQNTLEYTCQYPFSFTDTTVIRLASSSREVIVSMPY